jgi:hypothetical protein
MSTAYTELLQNVATLLGLPQAAFVATQELVIDNLKIAFDFQPLDPNLPTVGDVIFFSVLGRPTPEREGERHRLLLQGNHLWAGTGGATLGIQQEGGAVVIAMRLPLEGLNAEYLLQVLDSYADTARFWAAAIAGQVTATPGASTLTAVDQHA